MPSSHFHLIPTIIATMGRYPQKKILDIGIGAGKYGVLAKEYIGPTQLDGIEAHADYINDLHRYVYDTLYIQNTMSFPFHEKIYDLYLMIDIIEHLEKEDGKKLLNMIPGDIIVSTPKEFYQDDCQDIWEKHKSLWSEEDLSEYNHETFHDDSNWVWLIKKNNNGLQWNGEKWT